MPAAPDRYFPGGQLCSAIHLPLKGSDVHVQSAARYRLLAAGEDQLRAVPRAARLRHDDGEVRAASFAVRCGRTAKLAPERTLTTRRPARHVNTRMASRPSSIASLVVGGNQVLHGGVPILEG